MNATIESQPEKFEFNSKVSQVTIKASFVSYSTKSDWNNAMVRTWKVTLSYKGRRLTVPFYQGAAHNKAPCVAEVLSCLLSDSSSVDGNTFEQWASELGYDTDSRKAEKTYKACVSIHKRLVKFLGEDYSEFYEASVGY